MDFLNIISPEMAFELIFQPVSGMEREFNAGTTRNIRGIQGHQRYFILSVAILPQPLIPLEIATS